MQQRYAANVHQTEFYVRAQEEKPKHDILEKSYKINGPANLNGYIIIYLWFIFWIKLSAILTLWNTLKVHILRHLLSV